MGLEHLALGRTNNLPIKHRGKVHSGKVRSVYWLSQKDSNRIIRDFGYIVEERTLLGVMVISDRISAFDCNWKGEHDLSGVPGKGAALNQISAYMFDDFKNADIGEHHLLDSPHPLVWIVQKARPILVEGIVR